MAWTAYYYLTYKSYGPDFPGFWPVFWVGLAALVVYVLLLSMLARVLIGPVRKRGWYWRDAPRRSHREGGA